MADDIEINPDDVISQHQLDCEAAISAFERDLKKVRTGRASSGLVEGIVVEYYGSKTQLSHLGQIATPEARLITIQVFDTGSISSIEKAIQTSGLGLNPSTEGNTIRILVPALTEEGRRDLVKHLNKIAEEIRVSIRNRRRDANDLIKKGEKASSITKDDAKKHLEKIQAQTNSSVSKVDELLSTKEAECLEI